MEKVLEGEGEEQGKEGRQEGGRRMRNSARSGNGEVKQIK